MSRSFCVVFLAAAAALPLLSGCSEAIHKRDRGISMFQVGRIEKAQELLAASIREDAGDPKAYYYMGRVMHAQEQYEEALYYYQCCLQLQPGHEEARAWLEKARTALGPVSDTLMFLPEYRSRVEGSEP